MKNCLLCGAPFENYIEPNGFYCSYNCLTNAVEIMQTIKDIKMKLRSDLDRLDKIHNTAWNLYCGEITAWIQTEIKVRLNIKIN